MGLFAGEMRGEHARLFVSRLDKSVTDPAMLGTLSDRVDAGPAGLQMIVDKNAAIDAEAGTVGEFDIRANAGRDHHKIGFNLRAVLKRDRLRAPFAVNADCFSIEVDGHAARLKCFFQHAGRVSVELALHEPVHQVYNRDLRACLCQAMSGLEPEQATTDHRRPGAAPRCRFNGGDVAEIAEGHYMGQIHARHAKPDWSRTSGKHNPGVRQVTPAPSASRTRRMVELITVAVRP